MRMKKRAVNIGIAGMGFYFPKATVDTMIIAKEDNIEDRVYENTGVKRIFKPSEKDTTAKMAYDSSIVAIKDAGIAADDIDMIIVNTFRNDYWHWSMSAWLKVQLGAPHAVTLEITGGCASHFYAVETAVDQIAGSDDINTVLVVCSEKLFGYGWPTFLSSGSQALIIQRECPQFRYLGFSHSNLIKYHENAYIPYGGTAEPFSNDTEWKGEGFIENVKVDTNLYFEHIKPIFFDRFKEITDQLMLDTGRNISEVKYMVTLTQQKNFESRILNHLGIPSVPCGREYKETLGHFSGADPYIILDQARKHGKIKKGDLILNFNIGGVTWNAALLEY